MYIIPFLIRIKEDKIARGKSIDKNIVNITLGNTESEKNEYVIEYSKNIEEKLIVQEKKEVLVNHTKMNKFEYYFWIFCIFIGIAVIVFQILTIV